MDKISQKVYVTENYSKFKHLNGNRPTNRRHIENIKKSIEEEDLEIAIEVNENMEILDGQHTIIAREELGLPIHYVIKEGFGLRQAQRRNTIKKNWSPNDFVSGYSDMGKLDYKIYQNFRDKYNFTHETAIQILTGNSSREETVTKFRDGKLKISNIHSATVTADKLMAIEPYYDNFRRRSFIQCMLAVMNHPEFDYSVFLHKLSMQPTALKDCPTVKAYTELVEEIYNYCNRKKLNLRF